MKITCSHIWSYNTLLCVLPCSFIGFFLSVSFGLRSSLRCSLKQTSRNSFRYISGITSGFFSLSCHPVSKAIHKDLLLLLAILISFRFEGINPNGCTVYKSLIKRWNEGLPQVIWRAARPQDHPISAFVRKRAFASSSVSFRWAIGASWLFLLVSFSNVAYWSSPASETSFSFNVSSLFGIYICVERNANLAANDSQSCFQLKRLPHLRTETIKLSLYCWVSEFPAIEYLKKRNVSSSRTSLCAQFPDSLEYGSPNYTPRWNQMLCLRYNIFVSPSILFFFLH